MELSCPRIRTSVGKQRIPLVRVAGFVHWQTVSKVRRLISLLRLDYCANERVKGGNRTWLCCRRKKMNGTRERCQRCISSCGIQRWMVINRISVKVTEGDCWPCRVVSCRMSMKLMRVYCDKDWGLPELLRADTWDEDCMHWRCSLWTCLLADRRTECLLLF